MRASPPLPSGSRLPPSPKGDGSSLAPASQSLGWVARLGAVYICKRVFLFGHSSGTASDVQLVPLALVLFDMLAYNRYKESTHSIVDASVLVNVPKDIAYSGCRQSRLFYFTYLSL